MHDKRVVKDPFLALRLMLSMEEKKYDPEMLGSLPALFEGVLPQKNDFIF